MVSGNVGGKSVLQQYNTFIVLYLQRRATEYHQDVAMDNGHDRFVQ